MSSIGRRFDRESSSVFSVISPSGGICPLSGKDRHEKPAALNLIGKLNRRFSSRQTIAAVSSSQRSLKLEVIYEQ
jgi:hypothetical protein